jgi:uncharacterized protein DUF6551
MSSTTPTPRMVRLGDLIVDTHVQRNVSATRVDEIARDFDMSYWGTIIVSERADGNIHVLDGATRRGAGLKVEGQDFMVPALVYTGLTVAQEADMFIRFNNTKRIPPQDMFRVQLVAGDPEKVEIDRIAKATGWEVGRSISAIRAVEDIYSGKAGGRSIKDGPYPVALMQALAVSAETWGHDKDSANGHILKGLGAVFLRHPDVDPARLSARLAARGTASKIYMLAKSKQDGTHNNLHKSVFAVCLEEWNKRIRESEKIHDNW